MRLTGHLVWLIGCFLALTIGLLEATSGYPGTASAVASPCPPQISGHWSGTWTSTAFPPAAGTWDADLAISAGVISGTATVNNSVLPPNQPVTGVISCSQITFGTVGGSVTFTGTIDPDGTADSGTYAAATGDAGTWQGSLMPWPTFQHDYQRSGRTTAIGSAQPQRLWQTSDLNLGVNSSPSVGRDGSIYVVTDSATGGCGDSSPLLRIDAQTGSATSIGTADCGAMPSIAPDGTIFTTAASGDILTFQGILKAQGTRNWTFTAPGFVLLGSPTIAPDGTVYVVAEALSPPYYWTLYAVSSAGSLLWSLPATVDAQSIIGSPSIGPDGTVYLTVQEWSAPLPALLAVTPSGNVKWTFHAGNLPGQFGALAPAVGLDGTIYEVLEGTLYAIAPDGTERWHTPTLTPTLGSGGVYGIALDGSTVYASTQSTLFAMDASSGTVQWSLDFWNGLSSGLIVDGAHDVYVVGSIAGSLYFGLIRISSSGSIRWQVPLGQGTPATAAHLSAMGADGTIYVRLISELIAIGNSVASATATATPTDTSTPTPTFTPTATPTVTATPTPGRHKYVIFIEGLNSSLTRNEIDLLKGPCGDTGTDPSPFRTIKHQLLSQGFVCSDFLQFSYAGGSVRANGEWTPDAYTCPQSGQRIGTSRGLLYFMIRRFAQRHPNAEFYIVGHSLGGVVAATMMDLINDGQLPDGQIGSIITLDSPLNHVSAANFDHLRARLGAAGQLVALFSCRIRNFLSSPAARELADVTDSNRASIRAQVEVKTSNTVSRGVGVYTLGNAQDCIWFLTACDYFPREWFDDTQTQVVMTASRHTLFELGNAGCSNILCIGGSHALALNDPATVGVVAAGIGTQP